MDTTPATLADSPRHPVKLPPLSPTFISADDAAYWAHEQIGNRRDREYGGAILMRGNRYFATTPIPGQASLFTLNDVVSIGDDGKPILPAGYSCAAIYHSHPSDYSAFEGTDLTEDERSRFLSFFSSTDIFVMIRVRHIAAAHYLSGPDGSLLKYVASGSPSELAFMERRDTLAFHELIAQLAEAGELSVLATNTVWGTRGRIRKGLKVASLLADDHAMQPLFSAVFPRRDIEKVLPVGTPASAPSVFGYVLKVVGKDEYTAPVPTWEREHWVAPAVLFAKRADRSVRLPSNLRIDSIYCRVQAKESWQHPNFFTLALLAAAHAQWRAEPALYDPQQRLTLMLRSADNALLAYTFSGSEAEDRFMADGAARVEKQMKEGSLSPARFVDRVAQLGELAVLQVGTVWSQAGRVTVDYRAFEQLKKSLSPAFISADDAARYLHERIHSHDHDKIGYVFERADGRFVSTAPIASGLARDLGVPIDGRITDSINLPDGYRYAGFFAALGDYFDAAKKSLKEKPHQSSLSLDDQAELYAIVPNYEFTVSITAGSQSIPVLYYSSPYGTLLKYVRSNSQLEQDFSGFLQQALNNNEFGVQADGFDGSSQALARKLARLGELHVLVSNRFWGGSLGRVPVTWQPFQALASSEAISLSYSWVFEAAELAAEYAHDQLALSAEVRQLAFILKDRLSEGYVVTQPRIIDDSSSLALFSPQRVFAADDKGELVLPTGFRVHGVCYQSLPSLTLKPTQYWVHECFVDPLDLALAIAGSHEADHALRAIYLSTRDGAQLRYAFSASRLENQLYGVTPTGAVTDNGGRQALLARTLGSLEFVLQVAGAGELSVSRTSPLWDVAGVVDERWKPFSRYPIPSYSAPFLSADDAARWAHEQIGDWRDVPFCGHILQTRDQRFVATHPLLGRTSARFVLNAVFPTDHAGVTLVPEPYVMHGQYASCTAASLLDTTLMTRNGWSREQAYIDWQLFGDDDLYHIINNRHLISVAYLSSAKDLLIAYEPSGTAAEQALLQLWVPDLSRTPALRRQPGGPAPELRVVNLGALSLRVVQGNHLWGPAGLVSEHWRAGTGLQPHEVPEQVGFGAIYSSAREAAKHAHARLSRSEAPAQTCFGFVLKHEHKDEYVVSQMVPADQRNPLFTQGSLFRMDDNGAPVYPSGFGLQGLCYARRWLPAKEANGQQWLARHFLSSADLYSAFLAARRWRTDGSRVTLPVFISTQDGALLEFQTPLSTTLFDAEKQPSGQFEDVHTALASGSLSPKGFVGKVATLCWLSVIEPNECWDEQGKLGVDWQPYADFVRRALSPAFTSKADAARYAQAQLGTSGNLIRGGLLLRRVDGLYVATEPLPVPAENFDPKWILPDEDVPLEQLAPGMTIVARYRSRRDTQPGFLLEGNELQLYRRMFSTEVLAKALECTHLWSHEYLMGDDGSLISFTCNDPDNDLLSTEQKTRRTTALAQLKQDLSPSSLSPQDPFSNVIEQQLRDGRKTPSAFMQQLLSVASISVVQSSKLWGGAQKLSRGWLPAGGFFAPQRVVYATADRAMGPVFDHADDAARHAHEQAGERSELTYGFILKSAKGQWVASLPVNAEGLLFPLSRVFLRGQLPVGFTVAALYLCAPAQQPQELIADPIYRSFIPPTVLGAALVAHKYWTANQELFLPLYLSCTDGALLKYQALRLDSAWGGSETQRRAYLSKLNGGFNPTDYPRKVARAGVLQVLSTGEIWAAQGLVLPAWQPRAVSDYQPGTHTRVTLGPLFAHPDDAARYMWRRCRPQQGKAWLGAILRNASANTFLVTEPVDDSGPSVAVGLRADTPAYSRLFGGVMNQASPPTSLKYPVGYQVMGVQQLYKVDTTRTSLADRYQEALDSNFIAQPEFRAAISLLRGEKVTSPRYYFTPRNGALLAYRPSFDQSEQQMLIARWIDPGTGERVSTPSEVITTLSHSGRLYILEPDMFWQPRSQIASRLLLELRKTNQP